MRANMFGRYLLRGASRVSTVPPLQTLPRVGRAMIRPLPASRPLPPRPWWLLMAAAPAIVLEKKAQQHPEVLQEEVQVEGEDDESKRAGEVDHEALADFRNGQQPIFLGDPEHPPIYRIVLTGGPCGGKTTALAHINRHLSSMGFHVYVVPEASTLFNTAGASSHGLDTTLKQVAFEESLMRTRMIMEESLYNIAKSTRQPAVILCDRGCMDSMVYVSKRLWSLMLDNNGWDVMQLRDRRYDAIIHLVTTAIGAERFYTLENNPSRSESIEEAKALDVKTLNAWIGHPTVKIIDNSTDFTGKIKRTMEAICAVVGAPIPSHHERRFKLQAFPDLETVSVHSEVFKLEETHLRTSDGSEAWVARRGQHGHYDYRHTTEVSVGSPARIVRHDRQITAREYTALLAQRDPDCPATRRKVLCFMWENQYFVVSMDRDRGVTVVEVRGDQAEIAWPPFLTPGTEVTGEPKHRPFQELPA